VLNSSWRLERPGIPGALKRAYIVISIIKKRKERKCIL